MGEEQSYIYNLSKEEVIIIYKLLHKSPINASVIHTVGNTTKSQGTYEVISKNIMTTDIGVNGVAFSTPHGVVVANTGVSVTKES